MAFAPGGRRQWRRAAGRSAGRSQNSHCGARRWFVSSLSSRREPSGCREAYKADEQAGRSGRHSLSARVTQIVARRSNCSVKSRWPTCIYHTAQRAPPAPPSPRRLTLRCRLPLLSCTAALQRRRSVCYIKEYKMYPARPLHRQVPQHALPGVEAWVALPAAAACSWETSCLGCSSCSMAQQVRLAVRHTVPPPRRPWPSVAGCVPACWRRRPAGADQVAPTIGEVLTRPESVQLQSGSRTVGSQQPEQPPTCSGSLSRQPSAAISLATSSSRDCRTVGIKGSRIDVTTIWGWFCQTSRHAAGQQPGTASRSKQAQRVSPAARRP